MAVEDNEEIPMVFHAEVLCFYRDSGILVEDLFVGWMEEPLRYDTEPCRYEDRRLSGREGILRDKSRGSKSPSEYKGGHCGLSSPWKSLTEQLVRTDGIFGD